MSEKKPGRPKSVAGKSRSIYLSDTDAETAKLVGKGSISEGIRVALEATRNAGSKNVMRILSNAEIVAERIADASDSAAKTLAAARELAATAEALHAAMRGIALGDNKVFGIA